MLYLAHIRMLILSNYVLLESKNTIYKYGHADHADLVRCILTFNFGAQELYV